MNVAGICFAVALVVELTGVWLIVGEARKASAALQRWRDANPRGNAEGSYGQSMELSEIIEHLLGSQANRRTAVALLVFGVVIGTAGNYASL